MHCVRLAADPLPPARGLVGSWGFIRDGVAQGADGAHLYVDHIAGFQELRRVQPRAGPQEIRDPVLKQPDMPPRHRPQRIGIAGPDQRDHLGMFGMDPVEIGGSFRALIWYTYDEEGVPTWYIASGSAQDGNVWTADLLRFTNESNVCNWLCVIIPCFVCIIVMIEILEI